MRSYARLRVGRRGAFTLVEMVAVLALMAAISTVAVVALARSSRAARVQEAAAQLIDYDRLARDWSRQFGQPSRITFDLEDGTVRRSSVGPEDQDRTEPAALHLGSSLRIARVIIAGRSFTAGRVLVPCSTRGQTPSYAVLMTNGRGDERWTVFAGLTGKTIAVSDANEVRDLFQRLAGGDDAG